MTRQWSNDPVVKVCWSCDRLAQLAYNIGFKDGMGSMADDPIFPQLYPCLACGIEIHEGVCCAGCTAKEFSDFDT
jgi:hypothetical protein